MPDCRHCYEAIPGNFDVCWNCGAPVTGSYDPDDYPDDYPERQISIAPPTSLEASDVTSPFRFRIRHLLLLTTLVALGAAVSRNEYGLFIVCAVLVTNFIGVFIGLFVTSIWGHPNDAPPHGSPGEDSD